MTNGAETGQLKGKQGLNIFTIIIITILIFIVILTIFTIVIIIAIIIIIPELILFSIALNFHGKNTQVKGKEVKPVKSLKLSVS